MIIDNSLPQVFIHPNDHILLYAIVNKTNLPCIYFITTIISEYIPTTFLVVVVISIEETVSGGELVLDEDGRSMVEIAMALV